MQYKMFNRLNGANTAVLCTSTWEILIGIESKFLHMLLDKWKGEKKYSLNIPLIETKLWQRLNR